MSENIQVGVIGLVMTLTIEEDNVAVNISSATTKQIKVRKPDGSVMDKAADFSTNGSDGKLTYTTIADDIDMVGEYQAQAYVVMTGFTGHSTVVSFEAKRNL